MRWVVAFSQLMVAQQLRKFFLPTKDKAYSIEGCALLRESGSDVEWHVHGEEHLSALKKGVFRVHASFRLVHELASARRTICVARRFYAAAQQI